VREFHHASEALLLRVGLTGGIGSGKSAVGAIFASLGAHVIQADQVSHGLMQPGQSVYEDVVQAFGREILDPDGRINRRKLADAAFGTEEHAASRVSELNRIVHPAVIRYEESWMQEVGEREPGAIAMVEAALLLEAGGIDRFDRLVVVTCPFEIRVQRWARRTDVDEDAARRELERRMKAQLPDEEKVRLADYAIDNGNSLIETERQVREVFSKLQEQARATVVQAR
jgi:dephospho-CoA kinase